jgi:hypothetical protein
VKRRQIVLPVVGLVGVLGLLVLGAGLSVVALRRSGSPSMTFAECEAAGGEAWRVDVFDPDICPSCAAYEACAREVNDLRDVCPDCYGPCEECQEEYSLHESCPACYGPCQACQNEHLNDFESEAERYRLCPACKACDDCREALEVERSRCPPCVACEACRKENRRYTDIREVCPEVVSCSKCMERNFPYPDRCPGDREKIGEISDAAIWFQCCR